MLTYFWMFAWMFLKFPCFEVISHKTSAYRERVVLQNGGFVIRSPPCQRVLRVLRLRHACCCRFELLRATQLRFSCNLSRRVDVATVKRVENRRFGQLQEGFLICFKGQIFWKQSKAAWQCMTACRECRYFSNSSLSKCLEKKRNQESRAKESIPQCETRQTFSIPVGSTISSSTCPQKEKPSPVEKGGAPVQLPTKPCITCNNLLLTC